MKRRLVVAVVAVMILSLQASIASAQTRQRFKADIPFNFIVNGRTLPAGTYIVTRLDKHVIALGSDSEWVASIVIPSHDESRDKPRALVFRKIEHKYFLAQAWLDWNAGVNIPESAAEREALRAASSKTSNVTVAVR